MIHCFDLYMVSEIIYSNSIHLLESYRKALTIFTILIFKLRKDVWSLMLDNKTIKVLTVIYRLSFNKRETKTKRFLQIKVVIYTLCICKSQNFTPFKTKTKNNLDIFQRIVKLLHQRRKGKIFN